MIKRSMVKRAVVLILSMGMTLSVMSGCGKKEEVPEAKMDLKVVQEEMAKADPELPKMKTVFAEDEEGEDTFGALCDVDYDRIQDYFYSYEEEGGAVEFAVVFVKKESDVKDVVRSLKEHQESRRKTFENYKPSMVELAINATVSYNGNYVCYVMGPKGNYMKAVFEKALGI